MPKIDVGHKVPDFTFECTDSNIHSFKDLSGKRIVLYFYPKDNTPGCTLEGLDFTKLKPAFDELNTIIIGVSRDSLVSHQKFCDKFSLSFPLISDANEQLCEYFDVKLKKNWLLKKLVGIERTSFLIDENGTIKNIWKQVSAKGHAQSVLDFIRSNPH